MRRPRPEVYDAIVVGAGPAGSAFAIHLAERERSVLLLDKASLPRAKVCGEYLSPETARLLDRLGALEAVEARARPVRGMRIAAPDGTEILGEYPRGGRYRGYRDHALAIPRLDLDRILVERARACPLEILEGFRVTDLMIRGDQVTGVRGLGRDGRPDAFAGRLVIGADGRRSVVAQRLGLIRPHPRLRRAAVVTHLRGIERFDGHGEIYLAPPLYAILNPLKDGRTNVSLVGPLEELGVPKREVDARFARGVARIPALASRLAGAHPAGPIRTLGPLAYRVDPPRHGGVLLIGDAAGFYDPFTGEGIYTALRSAELAAEVALAALEAGDSSRAALAPYEARRAEAFAGKQRVTALLQALIARPRLANAVAHRLARRVDLLGPLMGVIGDFVPPRELLAPAYLRRLLL